MKRLMTFETIRDFAYVNDRVCARPIRGAALSFFGLNGRDMYDEDTEEGKFYGAHGILYVVPYNNPWAWMNRQAVAYTDEVLDVLFAGLPLPDDCPVISTGGSMGGLSALTYMVYAKRTPVACVANCPVCDLPYHLTERHDLPRTLYSAFWHEDGDIADVLQTASPLHLVNKMPLAAYTVFHCTADMAVNKQKHSDRFVQAMRDAGHDVSYVAVPDRGHCDLTPEAREQFRAAVLAAAKTV